jgi:hypothetical protein
MSDLRAHGFLQNAVALHLEICPGLGKTRSPPQPSAPSCSAFRLRRETEALGGLGPPAAPEWTRSWWALRSEPPWYIRSLGCGERRALPGAFRR